MTKRCGGEDTLKRSLKKAIRPEDVKPIEAEINGNEKEEVEGPARTRATTASTSSAAAAAAAE